MSNVLYQTVIQTTIGPVLLPAPQAGITQIRYTFRCTPTIIEVACDSAAATNDWQPLQFYNTAPVSVYIAFAPETVDGQWIDPDEVSTTIVGITSFSVSCNVITYDLSCGYIGETDSLQLYQFHNRELVSVYISFTPGTVPGQWIDPSGTTDSIYGITAYSVDCEQSTFRLDEAGPYTVVEGTTISIVNTYDIAAAIQFYNAAGGLVVVGPGANTAFPILTGTTGYPVVPATAVTFTATAAILYDIASCGQWSGPGPIYHPITPGFPLLFTGTSTELNVVVRFRNSLGGYVADLEPNPFIYGSVTFMATAPGAATQLETYCV